MKSEESIGSNSKEEGIDENQQNEMMDQKLLGSPQKRRGRPEKKPQPFFEEGQQLFTIHDNIFHAAIFDKAPTRKKFNPTIGYSVYQKVKTFPSELKKYFDDDNYAIKEAEPYKDNFHLKNFFINSLTFGPSCVIEEFYRLFHFIINKFQDGFEPDVQMCMDFIRGSKIRYMNFDNEVLDFLQAKTPSNKEKLKNTIHAQLAKLLQILIHTIECLIKGEKQNKFLYILESEENMFERGTYNRNNTNKKKVKKQ